MPNDTGDCSDEDMPTFIAYCLAVRHYIWLEWPFIHTMMVSPPPEVTDNCASHALNEALTRITWSGFLSAVPFPQVAGDVAKTYGDHLRHLGFTFCD